MREIQCKTWVEICSDCSQREIITSLSEDYPFSINGQHEWPLKRLIMLLMVVSHRCTIHDLVTYVLPALFTLLLLFLPGLQLLLQQCLLLCLQLCSLQECMGFRRKADIHESLQYNNILQHQNAKDRAGSKYLQVTSTLLQEPMWCPISWDGYIHCIPYNSTQSSEKSDLPLHQKVT